MKAPSLSGADPIELTTDEILLLRFTCELAIDEESAFGPLVDRQDPEVLRRSARSLVDKGLADRKTYRPHRELLRRLLVVSQPDCRIILLAAEPGRGERLLDLYGRAGAYVPYARAGLDHRLGPPLELVDVYDEIVANFTPRRSTGDFIDLRLTSLEYLAFSAAATELAQKKSKGAVNVRLDSDRPVEGMGDTTLDGAILQPRSLSLPSPKDWAAGLHGLAEKGAIVKAGETYQLRGYLHDLAIGLANRTRHVLTRIDFGAGDWFVRDTTLVHVPGSLFWLRQTKDGGLAIREVDPEGLRKAVRDSIDELSGGTTA